MKRTFKEKVLDIICNMSFAEEGKFHDTGNVMHLHKMEMCEEIGEAIEAIQEDEDGRNFRKNG